MDSCSPTLCSNFCGLFGSASTLNLCSKCYCEKHLTASFEGLSVYDEAFRKVPLPVMFMPDRCWTCKKRVKIARGYKCRCGFLFCESHRYPETHFCDIDYKALGREEIAKSNPMVKADKLQRI